MAKEPTYEERIKEVIKNVRVIATELNRMDMTPREVLQTSKLLKLNADLLKLSAQRKITIDRTVAAKKFVRDNQKKQAAKEAQK